ncbi:MAG: hypothetical protein WD468_05215, partial [Pirellulales bacterium]
MRFPIVWQYASLFLFLAANASAAYGDQTTGLLVNGSFEEGQNDPLGWNRNARGDWGRGMAHRGQRFARIDSSNKRGWESNAVALSPKVDYRLEGWIRAAAGEAHLEVDLLAAASGQLVRSIEAPHAEGVADWRYVAVEFTADAAQAKVRLAGSGPADFDDVVLAPVAVSYMGNRDAQPDAKGRIGLWDEEKDETISPGRRAGAHRSDPTVVRGSPDPAQSGSVGRPATTTASLMVESTGDWYAISSVNYGVPAFTDKIELSAWARAEAGATAQILACWMDNMQKVVRVDAGPETRSADWQR